MTLYAHRYSQPSSQLFINYLASWQRYLAIISTMQPETQQPMFSSYQAPTPSVEPPKGPRKKLLIIILATVVVLTLGIGAFFVLSGNKSKQKDAAKNQAAPAKPITIGAVPTAVTYAGNKVYEACNMIPLSVFQDKVEKYKDTTVFNSGTLLDDPLMIERGYIDRDIPVVLGTDGGAREPSVSVSETSVDTSVRAQSFMSIAHSYCKWGQGLTLGTRFAEVYVIQPPAQLHPKFLGYLDELKQKGKLASQTQGIDIYVPDPKQGDDQVVGIFKKGNTVVFLASRLAPVLEGATATIVNVLSKEPTGPMTATYPAPYQSVVSPCDLFTASDFERLLGKPASAVTDEMIALTETYKGTTHRECTRYEVERLRQGEVTNSRVTLMESRSEDQSKIQISDMKNKSGVTAAQLADLGDEAYTLSSDFEKSIVFRVGKRIVKVTAQGETKDTNMQTFSQRTLPVAQLVLKNLKNKS